MKSSYLFIIPAVIEFFTGIALLALPAFTTELLLGLPLTEVSGITVARIAGTALITLALCCWFARNDAQSPAARGVLGALLVYNLIVLILLAYFGSAIKISGMLWVVIFTHIGLSALLIYGLKNVDRKNS